MDGETETGITSMVMAAGIDTGDMLMTDKTVIGVNETAPELRVRLAELAAQTMLRTLSALKAGELSQTVQKDSEATYASMLDKEMSRLDFTKTAEQVHNLIRAVSGFAFSDGKRIKILRTRKTDMNSSNDKNNYTPGTLIADTKLYVSCADKLLEITELQPEGGKRITADEFLRGHKIPTGTVLHRE
jgi:methionyl-tRNA formyltransferase